jgi:hypothetical protein
VGQILGNSRSYDYWPDVERAWPCLTIAILLRTHKMLGSLAFVVGTMNEHDQVL